MSNAVNHIFNLPPELVQAILEHVVIINGLTEAVRLRLVCKRFDNEIASAISSTQALNAEQSVPVSHISQEFMINYLHRRVLADGKAKANVSRRLHLILESLVEDEEWSSEDVYRVILKTLVRGVVLEHGNEGSLRLLEDLSTLQDETFGKDRLHAAALLGVARLFDAIKLDELDTPERNFDNGNQHAAFTDSPLVLAAMGGQLGLVHQILLSRKEASEIIAYDRTERFKAIWCAVSGSHDATLQLLLDPSYGGYVVDYKTDAEYVLLNALTGTDLTCLPTLCTLYGITYGRSKILQLGLEQGRLDVVEKCITAGAHLSHLPCTHPKMSQTPLGLAAYHCRAEVIALLLSKNAKLTIEPYQFAAKMGYITLLRRLIHFNTALIWKCPTWDSPLIYAIKNGQAETTELLLDVGILNTVSGKALGNTALCEAVCRGFETVARILIRGGVDKDGIDRSYLPVLLAYEFGHLHIVRMLVGMGARHVIPKTMIKRGEVALGRFPGYLGSGVRPV
ncbi:ankyrin [Tothia fuscella]|uniref:Ankyrin n=1 Tax=Tothia fuscella TaxID=1048955 RepID=A0A9P4P279_9PEZI|nr:ankyrin [Tothia fuscella]